jgi:uncharacterized protein YktB (UPF0637 family)
MGFSGFTAKDFQVFSIPDFPGRMSAIRAQVQPKLLALGADLTPQFARLAGRDIFAHVAKHMRRTVNPPDDTWVAFGPDRRGYKKCEHFKVAVSRGCVRLLVEIGPEYLRKPAWAQAWRKAAPGLARALRGAKGVGWYKNEHDEEPAAELSALAPGALKDLAQELLRRKDGQLVLGRRIPRAEAAAMPPADLEQAAVGAFKDLLPVFRLL